MTNYMVITCKQKNGNLLVLKTYNYHELSINFCPLVLWSKKYMFFCSYVIMSKTFFCLIVKSLVVIHSKDTFLATFFLFKETFLSFSFFEKKLFISLHREFIM